MLLFLVAGCAPRRAAAPPAKPDVIPVVPRHDVAILFNSAPGYSNVAAELKALLPAEKYRLTLIDIGDATSPGILSGLRDKRGLFVVAIGLPAARVARDQLRGPIVFAQVFNYQELLVDGRAVRGVTAMPPLDLQVRDWKKLDPKLQRVGLIVSDRHADLIGEAQRAADAAGVKIEHEISGSDRETLYLFKRLAPKIDGLWLVPDDRILSPAVMRELLDYAVSHGVRVTVFSDALLQWGALMSASPTAADIARTVRHVLQQMIAGSTNAVPALTPLSEVAVRVNAQVADRLGLSAPSRFYVVRGGR